jgi:hypothetical protein
MNDPEKQLIELLSVLIAWKSSYSEEYIGPVCGPAREQHEVALLLEEHPVLAAASAIEDAIERARQAVAKRLPSHATPPERYTLAELLVPPLTAFGPAGACTLKEPYRDDWEEIEDLELELKLGDLGTPRLGNVVGAWLRDVDRNIFEIIEVWVVEFFGREKKHKYHEAECWYRYRSDRPDDGQVYSSEHLAFSRHRGMALSEALSDGLAHGLVLPNKVFG